MNFEAEMNSMGKLFFMMLLPLIVVAFIVAIIEDDYNADRATIASDYIGESVEYEFQSMDGYLIMNGESGKHYTVVYNEEDDKVIESQELSSKDYTLLKESEEQERENNSSDTFFIPIIMGR